jgi:hypothetical protein
LVLDEYVPAAHAVGLVIAVLGQLEPAGQSTPQ